MVAQHKQMTYDKFPAFLGLNERDASSVPIVDTGMAFRLMRTMEAAACWERNAS